MKEANETVGTANGLVNFGEAVQGLKTGKRIKRTVWPFQTFVFQQVPSMVKGEIVPKMTSLPDTVKHEFEKRFKSGDHLIDAIYYENQLALVNADNRICSYAPSVEDTLAEDWIVMD